MPAMLHHQDRTLRPMRDADLDAVLAVQAACYPPAMREPAGVVLSRLRAAPATTLVACDGAAVRAYAFAYPSRLGRITPLNAGFAPAPEADTLYVHDLAVAPGAHGRGVGRRLAQALFDGARDAGLRHGALVAVLDAAPFWASLGFAPSDPGSGAVALASYPPGAAYMVRALDV
jgi:ribosomal protein S18 acetylase RimI-like enzyme